MSYETFPRDNLAKNKRSVQEIVNSRSKSNFVLDRLRAYCRLLFIPMLLSVIGPHLANAQTLPPTYPSKPIRLIVAQAAGSTTDTISRAIGPKLSEIWGQQMVVDIRPGAGGAIGTQLAAQASPDGYTLLFANISTHGVNPAIYPKLPYDPVKNFSPVSMVAETPFALVVHPSVPARSVKEFVALAKARPTALNYATAGQGSSQHLGVELLKSLANINLVHVAYKGGSPALLSVISGETAVMMPTLSLAMPQIKNHKVIALGVTSLQRNQAMPSLPAVSETITGFEMTAWFAIVAPMGTPLNMVARLSSDLAKVLSSNETIERLSSLGVDAVSSSPEQLEKHIKSEIAKWTKVARAAGVRIQ